MKYTKLAGTMLLILFGLLCFGHSYAWMRQPEGTSGKLEGIVLDGSNKRIPKAHVVFSNRNSKYETKADEKGGFEIELPAGIYLLSAEAPGFHRYELSPFRVRPYVTRTVLIHLDKVDDGTSFFLVVKRFLII